MSQPLASAVAQLRAQVQALVPTPGEWGVRRLELPVTAGEPLEWLRTQPGDFKVYWQDRDEPMTLAGAGCAWQGTAAGRSLTALLATRPPVLPGPGSSRVRWFGGGRFPVGSGHDPDWEHFGDWRFFLPRLELLRTPEATWLACHLVQPANAADWPAEQAAALAALDHCPARPAPPPASLPTILTITDQPTREEWDEAIGQVVHRFHASDLRKLVLARRRALSFAAEPDPLTLVSHLRLQAPRCFHFLLQPEPGLAFLGASPELLYRRQGAALISEALAGTRPRGATPAEDARLGQELLHTAKDLAEHQLVMDSLVSWLQPICRELQVGSELQVYPLPRVQHLWRGLRASLRAGITDAQLLALLHPTPAVGGTPRDRALEGIAWLENFDRGWYASPVGWLGDDGACFSVAIRSGLLRGRQLALFAGAGLVAGSSAEAEWQEIETKLAGLRLALLGA